MSKDNWKHRSANMLCQTCMYFVAKVANIPDNSIKMKEIKLLGRCRRNAPTMKGFPTVFLEDWCGDHKIDENKI